MIFVILGVLVFILVLLGLFWEFISQNYIWLIPFGLILYFVYEAMINNNQSYEIFII